MPPPPTIAAAKGGAKAVICEKPMAIGMGAADSMVDGCTENGTKLVISHQRRFTPGWEKARALVEEGAIGEPLFVTNKVADGLPNWGTHSIDGSRFVLVDKSWPMNVGISKAPSFIRGPAHFLKNKYMLLSYYQAILVQVMISYKKILILEWLQL